MHHKRRHTTSRKYAKRAGHKAARRAQIRAQRGDRISRVGYPYDPTRVPHPTLPDEQPRHRSASKRSRKRKKQRCPVNGTHEWYRETLVRELEHRVSRVRLWECHDCRPFGPCPEHALVHRYEQRITTITCIHCWKEKKNIHTEDVLRKMRRARIPKRGMGT